MSSPSDEEDLHPVPGWGEKHGLTGLRAVDSWSKIPGATIAEIQQCINRYCWGFDDRRLDILSDCFVEDGSWEASVMGEVKIGPFVGRPQVLEWLSRFWKHQKDQRRHVFANLIVDEVDGNTAVAYSYLLLLGSSNSLTQLESVGFYRFSLERRDDRWLIAELSAGFDSPFWKTPLTEMSPRVRDLFGITAP
jgi:hypothetical protein